MLTRAAVTVTLALLVFALAWNRYETLLNEARLLSAVERLSTLEANMTHGTSDRFRRSDWLVQKELIDRRLSDLEDRIDALAATRKR